MSIGDFILNVVFFLGSAWMLCALGVATLRWKRRHRNRL